MPSTPKNSEFWAKIHERRAIFHQHFDQNTIKRFNLFRLIMIAHNTLIAVSERQLSKYNLSMSKMRIMFMLKMCNEDGGLLPSELSKLHGIMPNTVSSLVNSLRDSGLIEQAEHISDRRKRVLKITPAGSDLLDTIGPEHHRLLDKMFISLTDEEVETLTGLMQKLTDSVMQISNEEESQNHA